MRGSGFNRVGSVATFAAVVGLTGLVDSSAAAAVGESIAFQLVTSTGSPASGADVVVGVPGAGTKLLRLRANSSGTVVVGTEALIGLALPVDKTQGRFNVIVRSYYSDAPVEGPGTYEIDLAHIGFVFDIATRRATTTPNPDGARYTMRSDSQRFVVEDVDCKSVLQEDYSSCERTEYFDDDLVFVDVPFVENYGGGEDWASTLSISMSKTVQTEWFIKGDGGKWVKAEGKLTTTVVDEEVVTTPESAPVGDVPLGTSKSGTQTWQYVRVVTKVCGVFGFFCATDEEVRPHEWHGAIKYSDAESPAYPYDQAGPPGPGNFNCTLRYDNDVTYAIGHDTTLMMTMGFSASGGFRDEVLVEAEWTSKNSFGYDFNHTYKIVDDELPYHYLFNWGGLAVDPTDEDTCPEDGIETTYTDASMQDDLQNPWAEPPPTTIGVCPESFPERLRRAMCGGAR